MTIGAVSSPILSADKFYTQMSDRLGGGPDAQFDVKLLVRGEIGSDESIFYAMRRGRIQIAGVGGQSISTAVPELAVLNAPYLFDSWAEIDFIYDTVVTPFINTLLEEHGIVGLRLYGAAWHGIYAKTPIYKPSDTIDMRFRALIDPASQLFVQALGADTFQVASNEVVTGLQTGLIEAGETSTLVYNISGTSYEAPYLTRTRHTPSLIALVANKRWYETLTTEQQDMVMQSHPPTKYSGDALRADEERILAAAEHVTVIELTPQQLAVWKKVGRSTHGALIKEAGGQAQELYDIVLKAKANFAVRNARAD
ncbi:MAG: TRAP transporter substrate-binding protein [Rhodospirillaceae bacterium]|nr:TRAP transporter substrate-binding protein [Rhodospirillaceae bacterium]